MWPKTAKKRNPKHKEFIHYHFNTDSLAIIISWLISTWTRSWINNNSISIIYFCIYAFLWIISQITFSHYGVGSRQGQSSSPLTVRHNTCVHLTNLIWSSKCAIVSHSKKCFPFRFLNLQKTTSGLWLLLSSQFEAFIILLLCGVTGRHCLL